MKGFENARKVNSPSDFTSSQTTRSTIIRTSNTFNNFTNTYESKRPDASQGLNRNPISQSQIGFPQQKYNSNTRSMVGSQMMESHVWHTKRQTQTLSENRLGQISKRFLKMYGVGNQIRQDNVKVIQRQANHDIKGFQQDEDTVKGLFQVLDENHDRRITQDDIISLCRRYLSFERKYINYTPVVEQKLAVARRLFKQFDVQKRGYLTEKQVPYLLKETYKSMGRDFNSTDQDTKSWMRLTDNDNDGKVYLPEYQRSIVRALKKQGVQIYDD